MRPIAYRLTACLLLCVPLGSGMTRGLATAEQPKQLSDGQDRAEEALSVTRAVARSLQMYTDEDGRTELTLVESPVQRFSNPDVGEFYAHLFIWAHQARPAAAASIQKWYAPNPSLHVELQSLAERALTAEYKELTLWHPEGPGITFAPLEDVPAPAQTAAERLRQMRLLARQFRARVEAVNRRGEVDEQLRLLAQPVYRYDGGQTAVGDGAIFVFVRGTDPELLLLLEARGLGDAAVAWHYALAPMNSFAFHVFYGDREVWQMPQMAPPWSNVQDPAKPYMLIIDFDRRFPEPGAEP